MNPLLQYLIHDPTYGYLFAHRLAMVAFGLRHDSQLRKYYPQLTLNTDYLKLRGDDHVDRIFYTLSGLQKLVSFLQTPQSHQFWAELTQHLHAQQLGAMVSQPPSPLTPQAPPLSGLSTLADERSLQSQPAVTAPTDPDFQAAPFGLTTPPPSGHAAPSFEREQALVQLATYLEPAIERAIASQWLPTVPPPQTPPPFDPLQLQQQTADIIFRSQQIANDGFQKGAETATASQGYLLNFPNLFQEADDWLSRQDRFAVMLVYVSVIALASMIGYFALGLLERRSAPPAIAPQPGSGYLQRVPMQPQG